MIPEWEFRSSWHVALSAYMSGAAFGGLKDKDPVDLLAPWATPKGIREPGNLRLKLKGQEGKDMRLALRKGVLSQRLLDLFSA